MDRKSAFSVENKQNSYVKIHDTYEDFSYPPKLLTYFIYNNYFLIVKVENYAYDQADPGPTGEDYYYEIVKIDKEKGLIKLNKNQSISIMNKYFKKRLEDFYYRRWGKSGEGVKFQISWENNLF